MSTLPSLKSLDSSRFESPVLLKKLAVASRSLAELKGMAASIPNQSILINTLALQEAKDSSAIENIVTTHDDLFREEGDPDSAMTLAAKEVLRYRQALQVGFAAVRRDGLLTVNQIVDIQQELERNQAGLRRLPGTALKDSAGRVVYTPPQDPAEVVHLMGELEQFVNDDTQFNADPLIKMALIHHQFESIHPFYDGNGRTGRIVNVLYLVKEGLLDIPVLYLSHHIVRTKATYYQLLQSVRDEDRWEEWVMYVLEAVDLSAVRTLRTIIGIKEALQDYKHRIRATHRFYSQDLINNLFNHPYTRIEFVQRDLGVSRLTATKYLNALADTGFVRRVKAGRGSYYVNERLQRLLIEAGTQP